MNRFYDDWHASELDTQVICSEKTDGGYWITTAESNFYVKGGGMDSDTGTLNGYPVLDVRQDGDHVSHLITEDVSGSVHLSVDLYTRELHAEIHSAQHLLCGYINKHHNARTIAFFNDEHEEGAEMGFTFLNEEILRDVEEACNRYIEEDLPIRIVYPTREEASHFVLPEKLEHDELRAVRIGDIDYNMCACVHVPSLRYLRMIKITHYEKTTRGYKIFFVCGKQLSALLTRQNEILRDLGKRFSCPPLEVTDAITRLEDENKAHLLTIRHLEEEKTAALIRHYAAMPENVLIEEFRELPAAIFAKLCATLCAEEKTVLFLNRFDDDVRFIFAKPKDSPADLAGLLAFLKQSYPVRGGGSPWKMQGSIPGNPVNLLEQIRTFLGEALR
ncbi:MAG: hypothetical protein II783_03335 [Erysipelotrichales bacterium]|nr:hypothetical protein [Erysipelotrichales bacterium]